MHTTYKHSTRFKQTVYNKGIVLTQSALKVKHIQIDKHSDTLQTLYTSLRKNKIINKIVTSKGGGYI